MMKNRREDTNNHERLIAVLLQLSLSLCRPLTVKGWFELPTKLFVSVQERCEEIEISPSNFDSEMTERAKFLSDVRPRTFSLFFGIFPPMYDLSKSSPTQLPYTTAIKSKIMGVTKVRESSPLCSCKHIMCRLNDFKVLCLCISKYVLLTKLFPSLLQPHITNYIQY